MSVKVEIIVLTEEEDAKRPKKKRLAGKGPWAARLDTTRVRFLPPEATLAEVCVPPTEAKLEVLSEECALHWRRQLREDGHEIIGDYASG